MTKGVSRKTKPSGVPAARTSRSETTAASPEPKKVRAVSREEIAHRAYVLFLERGGEHGHDLADWLKAEAELTGAVPERDGRW